MCNKIPSRIKAAAPSAMTTAATTTTSIVWAWATLLLLPSTLPLMVSAYTPFGYQSDSSHSEEYKRLIDSTVTTSPSDPLADPSSFAGSIHYDPLHHSLYLTGATFASGSVFDGVDIYELTTTEQDELEDEESGNDGYWWNDMGTGLKPHLMDVGVPGWPASKGDCFYAVMALPESGNGNLEDPEGINSGSSAGSSGSEDANRVKMVHSRRFGSQQTLEACSALDILHASPSTASPGGFVHDFQHKYGPDDFLTHPEGTGSEGEGTHMPTFSQVANPDEAFETFAPEPTSSPVVVPTIAGNGVDGPTFPGESFFGTPTVDGGLGSGPTPSGNLVDGGPTTRRLRAGAKKKQEDAVEAIVQKRQRMGAKPTPQKQHKQKLRQRSMQGEIEGELPASLSGLGSKSSSGIPTLKTRSVRLLMAGHIESTSNQREGYIVENLPGGQFNEAQVYAFAQQVDVRLPVGDIEKSIENNFNEVPNPEEEWEYNLHTEGKEEDELAQELGADWKDEMYVHKEDFAKIVTSGVESRALLNDHVPVDVQTLYPVSVAADPTTKKHYYVALLASTSSNANNNPRAEYQRDDPTVGGGAGQRAWTDYENEYVDEAGKFGTEGKPSYGSNYRVMVKKMTIEAIADTTELTAVELELSEKSYTNDTTIAMRGDWIKEFTPDHGEDVRPGGLIFAPSGNVDGAGDAIIIAGTTSGRGSAFGTTSDTKKDDDADLDGFVTKLRADTGAEAGLIDLDPVTLLFHNSFSKRIGSNPGQREVVTGICAKPLRAVGTQDKMTHVYVVGSTSAVLEAVPSGVRSGEFLARYPETEGGENADAMEAFLMKIDLGTMKTVWTVQVGAIVLGGDGKSKGKAFGYGCAVTRDGEDVYLTGMVKENGVVTDFSQPDFNDFSDSNFSDGTNTANGGTDVFLGSYKTFNGARNFLKQFGSNRDDYPSRGDGAVTTDRFGNAIVTGNTRGSLMRERDAGEFRFGSSGKDGAMDVFIMSFDRMGLHHLDVFGDDVPAPISRPPPAPVVPPVPPAPQPAMPEPVVPEASASPEEEAKNGALAGVVALSLVFILFAAGTSALVIYRIRAAKMKEERVFLENSNNLHSSRSGDSNLPGRRKSAWGVNGMLPRSNSQMKGGFDDLNIMVEVRNSASGGWHGVYDDEQLQAIDFGVPSHNDTNGGGIEGSGGEDVVEQSLFMEDGLQEIEDSLSNYEIGDMNMDDVSDEELIRAYNEAMAVEIEPENPDVEFHMAGLGSDEPILNEEHHHIT